MDEQRTKRLLRFAVAACVVATLCLVAVVFLGSYAIRDLRQQVAKRPNIIEGPPGNDAYVDYEQVYAMLEKQVADIPKPKDGKSVKGPKGDKGPKGESIKGPKGEQGSEGSQGPPGFAVFISADGLQCRYAGDLSWQPIEECGP